MVHRRTGGGIVGLALAVLLGGAGRLSAQQPRRANELVFGMSTALTGPVADVGLAMRAGIEAAFAAANADGGRRGRHLRLVVLDDGYEPARTAPNVRRLIEVEHVLAIVGDVGTPTSVVAVPIVNASKVPFVGAFSGAGVLRRTPPDRYVVNFRASYAEETGAMVDALVQAGLDPGEIAFFTQRDAYGDAGFVGGIAALRRHGLTDESLIAHGRYERNTLGVENGLADILQHSPPARAVIMVGAYAPCAEFIRLAGQYGLEALFLNVSFVASSSLATALGDCKAPVIVTQVVPHFTSDLPILRDYIRDLHRLDGGAQPTFTSLEGYIAARLLLRALAAIDGEVTRESIVDALEGLGSFDLGLGRTLLLSPRQHQACDGVWPTILRAGDAVPFDWQQLPALLESGRVR